MFAKLLLKVANIIKREKVKPTIIANPPITEPTLIQTQPITVMNDGVPSISEKPHIAQTRCKTCIGSGFVKTNSILCDVCNGRKCMTCNSLGLTQLPWSECPTCYGSGEIRHL